MTEEFSYTSQDAKEGRGAHSQVKRMIHEFGDPDSGVGYIDPYQDEIVTPGAVIQVAMEKDVDHDVPKAQS